MKPINCTKNARWSGQLALPVSLLSRKLHYDRNLVDTTFTKRNVLFDIYSTYIRWNTNDQKYRFEMQYNLDSKAPEMNLFVNMQDTTDPLNVMLGNQNLKVAYKHEILTSFTRIYPTKGLVLGIEGLYAPTHNAIAMGYTFDRATGQRVYRPENVNGNWRAQLTFGGGGAINKKRTLSAKLALGAVYEKNVDLIGVAGAHSSMRSEVSNVGFIESLNLNYSLGTALIGVKSSGSWSRISSSRDDFQAFNAADFNYGLTAQIQLPLEFRLGTDLTMYSRRGYIDEALNTDELVWNARLSRSFFGGKLLVMLDGFDILGNLSNVTRMMNGQGSTETYTNVIPRYAMLHAAYKFNIAPKKK